MNTVVYDKQIEILRNRFRVRLVKNPGMDVKTKLYNRKKTFENDLAVIHKIKTTLMLNKPGYVKYVYQNYQCEVPTYEFNHDYI